MNWWASAVLIVLVCPAQHYSMYDLFVYLLVTLVVFMSFTRIYPCPLMFSVTAAKRLCLAVDASKHHHQPQKEPANNMLHVSDDRVTYTVAPAVSLTCQTFGPAYALQPPDVRLRQHQCTHRRPRL